MRENIDIQETFQEFTRIANGPDPASEKSGTHPPTSLQENKDNIRKHNALFQHKTPVVCREIFLESTRPDYSREMEIDSSQLREERNHKFPANADFLVYIHSSRDSCHTQGHG
jgi:hypothetical protein